MIQRCHKWRQKRKQFIDQARQTPDVIERERLLQSAEHYGRIVAAEQGKIDSSRGPAEKSTDAADVTDAADAPVADAPEDEDAVIPDFITNLK